jgi:hypothetical protein
VPILLQVIELLDMLTGMQTIIILHTVATLLGLFNKNRCMRILPALFITLISGNLHAQYRFIEPNISFRYNNHELSVKDSSANAVTGTEAYGFSMAVPGRENTYVQVSTHNAVVKPGQASEDSLYRALINQVTRYAGDSIIVEQKKFISHKGFAGLGYIARHTRQKAWSVAFYGAQFLEDGMCKAYYTSLSRQPIGDLEKDFVKFSTLLDGIQTYSKTDIQKEAAAIQDQYTVLVDSVSLSMPEISYAGMVRVNEKMNYTVHSVRMDYQSYFPDYRGNVIILCQDRDKGKIEKKAELIVVNAIGKKMAIPFNFTYYNK